MKFRRISVDKREHYFAKIDRLNRLKARKRRLYNRFYRRSLIYLSTTVLRILYLLFFGWIYFYQGGTGQITREKVLSRYDDIYLASPRMQVTKLCFETDNDRYEAHFAWTEMPLINPGETILIEHNVFGKPTFFSETEDGRKFELGENWILYLFIGMATVVSFAFNDGFDPFTDKILWVAWTLDLFAFGYYFLT